MAAFSAFFMQSPSFLAHQRQLCAGVGHGRSNCETLFAMRSIPSDNHIRDMLDFVEPSSLGGLFDDALAAVEWAGALASLTSLDGRLLTALDGTEYFCSNNRRKWLDPWRPHVRTLSCVRWGRVTRLSATPPATLQRVARWLRTKGAHMATTNKSSPQTAEEEKFEAQRKERIANNAESTDADLDDALDDSFPASDPPSMTQPKTQTGAPSGAHVTPLKTGTHE